MEYYLINMYTILNFELNVISDNDHEMILSILQNNWQIF